MAPVSYLRRKFSEGVVVEHDAADPHDEPASAGEARADGPCPRCGGAHTARQRCPLDPQPSPPPFIDTLPRDRREPRMFVPADQAAALAYGAAPRAPRFPYIAPRPVAWPHSREERRRRPLRTAIAGAGGAVAAFALIACVTAAGVYITDIAKAGDDLRESLVSTAIAAGVGIVAMLAMFGWTRTFAKVTFAALSIVLITGGLAMLVAAPIVRQMNTPELAEYRGFAALTWFGAVTTMLGALLAGACVRWSMARAARRHIERWARLGGAAYGVMLMLSGMMMLLTMLTLINGEASFNGDNTDFSVVEQAVLFAATATWLMLPGALLVYHCISASMGVGSGAVRLPVAVLALLAFAAVLALGHANMQRASPMALPMPPLHILAGALPGITYVALAGRGAWGKGVPVRGVSWRQAGLAVAIGTGVATMLAIYVESIGSLYAVALLLVHNGAFADARNADDVFKTIGDANLILTNHEQFAASLATASLLAPLSEEFGKSLAVRFTMSRTATRAQAFLLGAAAGAGFGLLESQFYGLGGIADDLGAWWQIMLLRGGSTSLHVTCTGLAGVGWWYWSTARRHRPALALFGVAVAIHASWNGFFTVLASRIFGLEGLEERTLEIIAYAVVAVASLAMILSLPVIARRLREPPPPSTEGTPLGAMAPWLG